MPLVYQQNINECTKLGVWHITEEEAFFLEQVPLQRAITHPNKRLQHLAGRYLLRQLFPDFPLQLVQIASTRKPYLPDEAYQFSISHCGAYAAVVVSTGYRVGVDVELVTPKVGRVKHKFLTPIEQELLHNQPRFPFLLFSDQLLTAAWSIKEALFKWQGSQEVDFKQHLQLQHFHLAHNEGTANCRLTRHGDISLTVHFLFFSNNCLSWVVSAN